MEKDTIAAISTPLGEGGIGIVRISGENAFEIGNKIFRSAQQKESNFPRPRYLYHGYIKDMQKNLIDEVLVSFMPAPRTYTRENIVEINCHSGIFTLRAILNLVLEEGARTAEPGEFTKRAFIKGRIDLSQAEAVLNMTRACSEEAVKTAAKGLHGELTNKVEEIKEKIINIRAPMEALFDYPDEFATESFDYEATKKELYELDREMASLLEGVEKNRAFQEGVSVAIIGKPNVGKSSLLNAMLQKQRAIVHEIPGTTRDILEGYMNLGGYPLKLVDTAGIQRTCDPVEKQGIELSRKAAKKAKLLIMVTDGSKDWAGVDQEIASLKQNDQGMVIAINKADLQRKLLTEEVEKLIPEARVVETIAIKGEGIKSLEAAVSEQLDQILGSSNENSLIVSIRHEQIIKEAQGSVKNAMEALNYDPLEMVSLELQHANEKLAEITGETINEKLLDKIFSEFCLGK
ncbi:MAG: tRNA uridine-5-carboxymethylaminomethyl(34) synthesis GTPase MnmE [Bacillota bacterium]